MANFRDLCVGARSAAMLVAALTVAEPSLAASGLGESRSEQASGQRQVAAASGVRVETDSAGAKIVFDLDAPVTPTSFLLADPDRVVVDLPQVDFRIDPAVGRPPGGRGRNAKRFGPAASFRFGLLSPGRSRIVIDLATPAKVVTEPASKVGDHYELVVALGRIDRTAFRSAARESAPAAPVSAAAAPPVAPPSDRPVIIIDPGHGGPDNGAVVHAVVEKDVTLAFGKMLAAKLESHGGFKVMMTRSSDVFIPLSERVQIARGAGAALMVSIHADTLPGSEGSDVSGATVYTVSDRASDAYAAKLAAKENQADAAAGVDGQKDAADVHDILFDLTRQETRAYSHVFARTLVNYWKVAGRLNKNPQRSAGFVVLKAPDVPSVLLELGYLSSPSDSASLTSDAWREQASGRMAEAIEAYFADRSGASKPPAPPSLRQAVDAMR